MADKIRSFVIDGEKVSVPAAEGEKVLGLYPQAKEFVQFKVGNDTIPILKGEVDMFKMKFKDYSLLPEYDFNPSVTPSNTPLIESDQVSVNPESQALWNPSVQTEVETPTVQEPPQYELDGKEFADKDAFLKEVAKSKGKPNTPRFNVSNDEETLNQTKGLLLEDDFYNKKLDEGDATFGVSTYAMEKHGRDNYGKVSEKVKAVDEKVVGEYTAKFEADQKALSLTADKEAQSLKDTEDTLTAKAKEINANLSKAVKALDSKDPKSQAEADRLNKDAEKQIKAVSDEYNSAFENYKTKVKDLDTKAQELAAKYDSEANVSLEKEHKKLADSVGQSEYFDNEDEASIQKALENAPVGYAEKKAYIQDLVDTYSAGFDAEDLPQVKKDLFAMVPPKVLFDEKGDPTVYTFKNQADTQMRRLTEQQSDLARKVEASLIKNNPEAYRSGVSVASYANDLLKESQTFDPLRFGNKTMLSPELRANVQKLAQLGTAIGEYQKVLASPEGTKTIKAGGFWENFTKETAANVATAGFYGAMEAYRIADMIKQGEKIKPEDKEILNAIMLKNAVEGRMQDNYSMAKIVGQGLAASLPFITSMVISGGAAGAVSTAAKKALKWQLMKTTLNTAAGASNFAKGAGAVMASAAVRVPMSGMFYEGLEKRRIDVQSKFVGNKFEAEGKVSENSAAWDVMKQFIATYPDFLTEGMEPAIAKYLTAPVAKKLGLAWLTDKGKGQLNKWVGRAANATNMHDLPTEILSEELAGVMGIATGEQKADEFFNRKSQMALILTVAAMSTPMSALKAMTSKPDITGMEAILNPTQVAELNKIVSLQNISDKAEKLTKFSFDNNLSDDQVMEVATYAWDKETEQVQNIAETAPVPESEAIVSPTEETAKNAVPEVVETPSELAPPPPDSMPVGEMTPESKPAEVISADITPEDYKVGDEIENVGIITEIKPNGAIVVKQPNGNIGFTTPDLLRLAKNQEPTETKKEEPKELTDIESAINEYDNTENYTIDDLVNDTEAIAEDSGNKVLIKAIKKYRKEQAQDTELKGRGNLDEARDVIEAVIRQQSKVAIEPISLPEKPKHEITQVFENLASGAKFAGVLQTIDRFNKGEEVVFKNPEAIKSARESEYYNTEEQSDGSLKVIGIQNPETGEWVGKAPKEKAPIEAKLTEVETQRKNEVDAYWSKQLRQIQADSEKQRETKRVTSDLRDQKKVAEEFIAFVESKTPEEFDKWIKDNPLESVTLMRKVEDIYLPKLKYDKSLVASGAQGGLWALGFERTNIEQAKQLVEEDLTPEVDKINAKYDAQVEQLKTEQAIPEATPLPKGEVEATDQELSSISPKGAKDVYTAGRKIFGLNRVQSIAQAIIVDRVVAKMAKNLGISKLAAYEKIEFRKADALLDSAVNRYYQAAWHGSPYAFDKFTTEKMGTGEGAQAFGWGLYFTDIRGIAEGYATTLSQINNDVYFNGEKVIMIPDNPIYNVSAKLSQGIDFAIKYAQDMYGDYANYTDDYSVRRAKSYGKTIEFLQKNRDKIEVRGEGRNLYKVELHKGKTPEQYEWLAWDKPLTKSMANKIKAYVGADVFNDWNETLIDKANVDLTDNELTGREVYSFLQTMASEDGLPNADPIGGNVAKEASLFLLRAGIDGIKYPAESLARGMTSDTARGFNYVVFDENAITIEEVIKFQNKMQGSRGAMMMNDGKALVYAMTDPNVSTPLHEISHVYEQYMTKAEKSAVLAWTNEKSWTVNTSEKFARGFERYLADGVSPSKALEAVFKRLKEWLADIYNGIKGSDIDIQLSPNMKALYDSILTGKQYVPTEEVITKTKVESLRSEIDDLFGQIEFQNAPLFQIIGEQGAKGIEGLIASLSKAKAMSSYNVNPKIIFHATGWEKFPDGWRFDVIDNFEIDFSKLQSITPSTDRAVLSDFMTNDELYKAYPSLKDIKVNVTTSATPSRTAGSFSGNSIWLSHGMSDADTKSVLIHEVQHAIQAIEGFSRGGNIESGITALQGQIRGKLADNPEFQRLEQEALPPKGWFKGWSTTSEQKVAQAKTAIKKMLIAEAKKLLDKGTIDEAKYEAYLRIAGEVEARNVQKRANMTLEERKDQMLSETQEVQEDQKIYIQSAIGGKAFDLGTDKVLFQGTEDVVTKAINKVIDLAEETKEADIPSFVRNYVTSRKPGISNDLITEVLNKRGYSQGIVGVDKEFGKAMESAIGLRLKAGVKAGTVSQEQLDNFLAKGLGSYFPQSKAEAMEIAEVSFNSLGNTPDTRIDNAMLAVQNTKMSGDVMVALLARASREASSLEDKSNNETTKNYYVDKKSLILEIAEAEGLSMGRGISYFNSDDIRKTWGPRDYVRSIAKANKVAFDKLMSESVEGTWNPNRTMFSPDYKNGELIPKGDLKKLLKAIDINAMTPAEVKEVMKDAKPVVIHSPEVVKAKDKVVREVNPERKKINDLFSEWKQIVDQKKSGILFQEARSEQQILSEIIGAYIRNGVYKTEDIIAKVKAEVKAKIGLNIANEAILSAMPTTVDNKPLEQWQGEQSDAKAADVLANRLKALVSENTPDTDPVRVMIRTLVSKASEKINSREKAGKTDIQIIAMAIQNRKQWMDVWNEAKKVAFEKIDKSKVTDDQKLDMKARIEEAYRLATKAPFSEALLDRTLKATAVELGIRIDKVIMSADLERKAIKEELTQALIDEAGLSGDEATALAEAVKEAFDNFLDVRSMKQLDLYIAKQDKLKPIPIQGIVKLLKQEALSFRRKFPKARNVFEYMQKRLRFIAEEKLRNDPSTSAMYTDEKLKGMSDANVAAAAFLIPTEVSDVANLLSADVRDAIESGWLLDGFSTEDKANISLIATTLQSESIGQAAKQQANMLRSRGASELVSMVRIGAFNNSQFLKAFSLAKGIMPPTPAQISEIARLHDRMKAEKSDILKREKELDLLAYIANLTDPDPVSVAQTAIVAGMLGGIKTFIYNAYIGTSSVVASMGMEVFDSLIKFDLVRAKLAVTSFGRAFIANLKIAKGVIQSGYSHETAIIDIPTLAERQGNARSNGLLSSYLNYAKYIFRMLSAPDAFNIGTAAEMYTQLRAYDELNPKWKESLSNSKKEWVKNFLYADLGLTPQAKSILDAEFTAFIDDAAQEGRYYSKREQTLIKREIVDAYRAKFHPRDWTSEAFVRARRTTGNIESYGTLGKYMEKSTRFINGLINESSNAGKWAGIGITSIMFFLRIATNTITYGLNGSIVMSTVRLTRGGYGSLLKEKDGYFKPLTPYDRKAIEQQRRFSLILFSSVAAVILGQVGGDDDDPWFTVTGGGGGWLLADPIAAANRSKTLNYQPFSLKFGNTHVSYANIPAFWGALAPLGNVMDQWRYGTTTVETSEDGKMVSRTILNRIRYKDAPMDWFASRLIGGWAATPLFAANQLTMPVLKDFSDLMVSGVNSAMTKGEEGELAWKETMMAAIKYSNVKAVYSPSFLRDMYETWAWANNQALDDGDALEKILTQNTFIGWAFQDEDTPQINAWGKELTVKGSFLVKRIASSKEVDPVIAHHNKWSKEIDPASMLTRFHIPGDDPYVNRPLKMTNHKEWLAYYKFAETRGRLIYEAARQNMGRVGQEYSDVMKKEIEGANKTAKLLIQDDIDFGRLPMK